MRARSLLLWIAVGLTGLVLAAGVSYAATQLSSQRIGLSAEPPSAGEELAPPASGGASRTTTPSRPRGRTGTSTSGASDEGGGEQPRSTAPEEHREAGGHSDWDD
jgi:hypothetical protein